MITFLAMKFTHPPNGAASVKRKPGRALPIDGGKERAEELLGRRRVSGLRASGKELDFWGVVGDRRGVEPDDESYCRELWRRKPEPRWESVGLKRLHGNPAIRDPPV